MQTPRKIEVRLFSDDGDTPNHPTLPLIVMHATGAEKQIDPGAWFERRFVSHDWGAAWRWTVYSYQHYHSSNHEVLGVVVGTATLLFGGESGHEFEVSVGDAIIIPAGVGHKLLKGTDDFKVVGAYPKGREPDLLCPGIADIRDARQRIVRVPLPELDPVFGENGPLCQYWNKPPEPHQKLDD